MFNDNDTSDIEVFSSNDYILIELICETLSNANIEYIKLSKGTAVNGFMKIYTGLDYNSYKICVAKENEEKAIKIIRETLNIYNAKIDDNEIPEELKDNEDL